MFYFISDLERVREGIGSKFSMVTQYSSTFFTGLIIGFCVNWRLTLIIICVAPFLIAVSGALAIVNYYVKNHLLKLILFYFRFHQVQQLENKLNML